MVLVNQTIYCQKPLKYGMNIFIGSLVLLNDTAQLLRIGFCSPPTGHWHPVSIQHLQLTMSYYFAKTLTGINFEDAVARATEALRG